MTSSADLLTVEQLARDPYSERSCELVDGVVVDVSPASWRHGVVAGRIMRALIQWADAHGGEVVSAETGFVLRRGPDTVRAPDVAFVRAGREVRADPFVEGAPDVVVEVLSGDARVGAIARKVRDYLDAGAAQVWVADPDNRTLTVHTPPNRALVLNENETLTGGTDLAGFELAVGILFGP
jgi:Uma2 family endonuclease